MRERPLGARVGELRLQCRDTIKQPLPRSGALLKTQLRRELIRRRDACAGEAVVKLENPDPSAVKDVVNSGVIDRKGRLAVDTAELGFIQPAYAGKMTVETLCRRIVGKRNFLQLARAR